MKWKLKYQPDEKYDFTFGANEQDSDDGSDCCDDNYINLNNRMPEESPSFTIESFVYEPEPQQLFNPFIDQPLPEFLSLSEIPLHTDHPMHDGATLIFE